MPKKKSNKEIKCDKCDHEFHEDEVLASPGKVYVHKGKVVCEDCLVDMGVLPDAADSYSVYVKTHTMGGMGGMGGV